MKSLSNTFSYATIGSLGLIGIALCIFPGAPLWSSLFQMLGILVITLFVYRKVCPETAAGRWILLAVWTILGIGFALNVWYYTTYSGGTLEAPVVTRDALNIWTQIQNLYHTGNTKGGTMADYARLIYYLNIGGTPTVNSYIVLSILSLLLTMIFTGAFAAYASGSSDLTSRRRISTMTMLLMACITHFIGRGDLFTKDIICCLIMSLALYAIARLTDRNKPWISIIILACCGVAAYYARPHLLIFSCIAFFLLCFVTPRKNMIIPVVVILLFILLYWLSMQKSYVTFLVNNDGTTEFSLVDDNEKRMAAFSQVIPDYENAGILRKILYLPFTMAVQFLIPLPWSTGDLIEYGPTLAIARFTYPWYLIGGIIIFYLIRCIRRSPKGIMLAALFGLIATAATAYVTGGTVSRYCLLWLPALVPCAAWVLTSGRYKEKDFRIWAWIYGSVLVIGLIIVAVCLHIYSPGGWG